MRAQSSKTINLKNTTAQRLDPHELVPLAKWHWLILGFVFLLALTIRLPELSRPLLDAKSAWVGLMATHLNKTGEFSAFLWGHHLTGSPNALLAGLFFSVFGVSRLSLNLMAFFLYLVFLLGVFVLTRELYGRKTGLWALFLTGIGPDFMIKSSLLAQGGGMELLCLGVWLFWCTVKAVKKPAQSKTFQGYALTASLLAGLGFWAHPFFICFILASGIIFLRQAPIFFTSPRIFLPMAGFLAGASPLIHHSLNHPLDYFKKLSVFFGLKNLPLNLKENLFIDLSQALGFFRAQRPELQVAWYGWVMAGFFLFFVGVAALAWGKDLATSPPKPGEQDSKSRGSGILLLSLIFTLAVYLFIDPRMISRLNSLLGLHLLAPVALAYVMVCVGQDKTWFKAGMRILTALTVLIWLSQSFGHNFTQKPLNYPQGTELAHKAGQWFNSNKVKHVYTLCPELAPMLSFDCGEKPLFTSTGNKMPLVYMEKIFRIPGAGFLLKPKDAPALAGTLAELGLKFKNKHLGDYRGFYLTGGAKKKCTIISASGIKATADSLVSPGLALDQNMGSFVEIIPNALGNQHLTLDLGRTREDVSQLWIFGQKGPGRLTLETSLNALDWRTILITDNRMGTWAVDQNKPVHFVGACLQELKFPPHKARYLRLMPKNTSKLPLRIREIMVGMDPMASSDQTADAALWLAGQLKSSEKLWCPPLLWAQMPRHLRAACNDATTGCSPALLPDPRLHMATKCQNLAVPQNWGKVARKVLLKSGWSFQETTSYGYTFFQAAPPVSPPNGKSRPIKNSLQKSRVLQLDLGQVHSAKALQLSWSGPGGISRQDITLYHSSDGENWFKTPCQLRHSPKLYWAGFLPLAAEPSRVILEFKDVKCRFLRLDSGQYQPVALPQKINARVYGN
ncbi:glycosyltransferase family 39 protein [Dethiosulfatarculus sandiegensis]|uniref:Glycosyltransferase RgtA/B/C/D-like domain-containing protein n=1 Tax=Dethiosulfatarculus sandiegensis TaxID=1429043 RepID=A0A0D2J850_9BACT|nr:glycosyltransferase family 39 protein [Dethiosulfatarculus sandiegensis]KIX14359.1 hypothetical protein X474_08955 [Dethiosulfatarculus sandiegensis]